MTDALPAQLVRTRRFTLGVPDQFTVTRDGTVFFLRSRGGDDPVVCLWALSSGVERLLVEPEGDVGIGSYAVDPGGQVVAFELDGELWTVRDGRLPTAASVSAAFPDPTGRRIGYVSDGAVRVVDADGALDRLIVEPDGPEVTFGVAPRVMLDESRGWWWSPDGTRMLVARVDSARVELWHIADPTDPTKPPRTVRYAAAGKANADVGLWIVGLDGVRVEARCDLEYIVGAGWDSHGPYAVVQSRDQRIVRFLAIDPDSGETTVLSEQRDDCWVQLVPGLPSRTASGAVVTHADLQGTRHLTVDGTVVTPPGLQLRGVHDVSGEDVLFTASTEPTETHVWRYRSDGLEQLSVDPGVHSAVSRDRTVVLVSRGMDVPGGRVTVLRGDKPVGAITSLVERPVLDLRATPLVLGPRGLRGVLHLPSWHGGGQLPVLLDGYGGAGRQRVTAELDWRCLVSQWFAEQGFAVLVVDGVGTPGRGPDWEREVHGDHFGPALDDQVTALHAAAREHPVLDLSRVGVRGWSFGGSLAALAVLRHPEIFHAAVAGAGVTDQRLYSAHWRERFLGHPDEFPERYEKCSLLRATGQLTRPLLLIHGLADDNVHPANTLRLSQALLAANRPHELLLLPGVGHQSIGHPLTEQLLLRQLHFLQRHLAS